MSTLSKIAASTPPETRLRPFDVRRDLRPVADLVELCFADTLDPDGQRYLQQMRMAAQNPALMRLASAAGEWSSVPMRGYVWEEDNRLIGNLTVIPFAVRKRRYFLIANVAVHPDYRRRGIARRLTEQGLEHARQRGASAVWLHVRQENEAAARLYRSLDFVERARRTTWHSDPQINLSLPPPGMAITARRGEHWQAQSSWLRRAYPPELTWHLALNLKALRPGLPGMLYRLFTQIATRQWSLACDGRLVGVLSWLANPGFADSLWLAASSTAEEAAAYALLLHARQNLTSSRRLVLDYPAGHADEGIQAAGFHVHQTLIWMENRF